MVPTSCRISVANYVGLSMVIESQLGPDGMRQAEALFRGAGVVVELVTLEHGELARKAFLDFVKARHKAGLNFGDCFSYPLAKSPGEALLFNGAYSVLTDIRPRMSDPLPCKWPNNRADPPPR